MGKDSRFVESMVSGEEEDKFKVHHSDLSKKDMIQRDLTEDEEILIAKWKKKNKIKVCDVGVEDNTTTGQKMALW